MIVNYLGDIFNTDCECIVNPVNCVGVMGKGLALEFKKRFPQYYTVYKKLCRDGQVIPGRPMKHSFPNYEKDILSFPTKDHYKDPSKLEYIAKGLQMFADNYYQLGIKSIAFPALGCGCGGLNFDDVYRLMKLYLEPLPIECEIYFPRDWLQGVEGNDNG
jgi:O-acetyl-ADP-ribose deacetylase (regulator of RNase III)